MIWAFVAVGHTVAAQAVSTADSRLLQLLENGRTTPHLDPVRALRGGNI
jgi:hypothetical protein